MSTHRLILGEALDVVRTLPTATIDAVISDPPYPEIDRDYGKYTESQWHAMMHALVPEVRRVLKPTGSAVFVLQPNSRKVGSMRPWLFEFQAWCCRRWNMVQDAWWWNYTVPPAGHAIQGRLMRPSVKACVWCGPPECWRDQEAVLWTESQRNIAMRCGHRVKRERQPSGHTVDRVRCGEAALRRGGVTPFNCLPIDNADHANSAGAYGHGAGTPLALCDWWCRYICPPGGTVLDPFSGTATVGVAALKLGRNYIGIEKEPQYHVSAQQRLTAEVSNAPG